MLFRSSAFVIYKTVSVQFTLSRHNLKSLMDNCEYAKDEMKTKNIERLNVFFMFRDLADHFANLGFFVTDVSVSVFKK